MRKVDLISVVIPAYNAQKYLTQCLDSVLANTWQALEIICVNDGSTDRSKQIILDYAQKDPRLVLIDQPNRGVSAARNAGLARARGDCVAFVDADDFVAPDYFASLAGALERSGADIVVCDAFRGSDVFLDEARRAYAPDKKAAYGSCGDRIFSDGYLLGYIWGRLYAAPLLKDFRFSSALSLGEDMVFNIQLYTQPHTPTVFYSSEQKYFYRTDNSNSLTGDSHQNGLLQRAEWCLTPQYDELNERAQTMCLDIAFKSLWSYRYLTRYSGGRQKTRTVGSQCRQRAKRLPLSLKTRLKYALFTASPSIYRLFRLLKDPSLIQWEKEQKRAAKNRRKSHE